MKADGTEKASELIVPLEKEVREFFCPDIFAIDQEIMEDTVGKLLRVRATTIAVIENLTGGMIGQRLQQAARESLAEAMIAHTEQPIRRVLRHGRHPDRVKELLSDDAALTEELACRIRAHSQADPGLAVPGIPDHAGTAQNLSPGKTYMAVADAEGIHTRVQLRRPRQPGSHAHDHVRAEPRAGALAGML